MNQAFSVIHLHLLLLTKGDRILWVYFVWLGILMIFVALEASAIIKIPIFLFTNLYLIMAFNKDQSLIRTYFYDVLGVSLFQVHFAKLVLLLVLVAPQLVLAGASTNLKTNFWSILISLAGSFFINLCFYKLRSNAFKILLFLIIFLLLNISIIGLNALAT